MSSEKSSSVIGFVLIGVILLLFSWYNTKQYQKQLESNRKFQDSLAMVKVYRELEKRKLQSAIVLQVHDELVLDVCKPEMEEVESLVREAMLGALPIGLPLEVDIRFGKNWLEAH